MAGDYAKEEFTDEEQAALGEDGAEVDDSKTDEGAGKSQTEVKTEEVKTDEVKTEVKTETENKELSTEEKEVADQEGVKLVTENGKQYLVDDEGAKIPVERWRRNFAKTHAEVDSATKTAEEINRKYNLLKELGTDKYYELYPDEKPASYQPPVTRKEDPVQPMEDFNTMIVTGGKYDGWQLGDVAKEDPIAASVMLNNYLEGKRAVVEQETRRKADFERGFEQERADFCYSRAKELFNKSDNYSDEEKAKVVKIYEDLSKWMIANKKSHYNMEDAYALMNKDKIIASKVAEASKAAIEKASQPGVKSIGSVSSDGAQTGFESYLTMTEDQLADVIDKMSDKDQRKFYKEAPAALKAKYPSLPW